MFLNRTASMMRSIRPATRRDYSVTCPLAFARKATVAAPDKQERIGKKELITAVMEQHNVKTKAKAERIVNTVIDGIAAVRHFLLVTSPPCILPLLCTFFSGRVRKQDGRYPSIRDVSNDAMEGSHVCCTQYRSHSACARTQPLEVQGIEGTTENIARGINTGVIFCLCGSINGELLL